MSDAFHCSQEMWRGSIPIEFSLCPSDMTVITPPDPFFVLAPRCSFLPVIAVDAVEYFRNHAVEVSSEVWFEANEVALKTNCPVGVLFDLHSSSALEETCIEPWSIVVHFQAFPGDRLMKCNTIESSEKLYYHSLKQALFLLDGSTNAFNKLPVEQRSQLWESCNSGGRGLFEQVARGLRQSKEKIKSIPVRVCCGNAVTQKLVKCFQKPDIVASTGMAPVREEAAVPEKDISEKVGGGSYSSSGDGICVNSESAPGTTTLGQAIQEIVPSVDLNNPAVTSLIQGIYVPMCAPLFDVWNLLAHPDLFLYISIRDSRSSRH